MGTQAVFVEQLCFGIVKMINQNKGNASSSPFESDGANITVLCRDCYSSSNLSHSTSCIFCRSPRLIQHSELNSLTIAHVDCDAFYASVEKRDNPSLRDKPVIIGGKQRGVVSAACYIARTYGIHSAMPMFLALRKCPKAIVIKPDMRKYRAVSRQIRQLMLETTPLVEPVSIDEAFLDLSGTERLHQSTAATTMARLATTVTKHTGITVSIGLSYNKFLAKLVSDMDKPNGFSVLGRKNIEEELSRYSVSAIWGVGKSLKAKLSRDGIHKISHLQMATEINLKKRYGLVGQQLFRLSRGIDERSVNPISEPKSVSKELTFESDISGLDNLQPILWRLCDALSGTIKNRRLSGQVITLKLKTTDFKIISRQKTLSNPTQLADVLFKVSSSLLKNELNGTYRLIGVAVSELRDAKEADPSDLLTTDLARTKKLETTIDQIRSKLGENVIGKGRGYNF